MAATPGSREEVDAFFEGDVVELELDHGLFFAGELAGGALEGGAVGEVVLADALIDVGEEVEVTGAVFEDVEEGGLFVDLDLCV